MIHSLSPQSVRDPDETIELERLIEVVVPDPAAWKTTPNAILGGARPAELIDTPREYILRDLLRAAKHGNLS